MILDILQILSYVLLGGVILLLLRKPPYDGTLTIEYDDEDNKKILLRINEPDKKKDGDELLIEVKKYKVEGFDDEDFKQD